MPRVVFDSDTPDVLWPLATMGCLVATYADLITPAMIADHGPVLVGIDRRLGDPHGWATVADCESGAFTPAEAAAQVREWQHEGRHGCTIYHDRAQTAEVARAAGGLSFYTWIATLDGTLAYRDVYTSLTQFAGEAVLGFHADISVCWDDRWHPERTGYAPSVPEAIKGAYRELQAASGRLGAAIGLL